MSQEHIHEFNLTDCPVTEVKVFNQAAEVKRILKVTLKEGEQRIILRKLPSTIVADSARVSGESESNVTVLEVSLVLTTQQVQNDQTRANGLTNDIQEQETKLKEIDNAIVRVQHKQALIENYSQSITNVPIQPEGPGDLLAQMTSEATLDKITNFLSFYGNNLNKVEEELEQLNKERTKVNDQLSELKANLAKEKPPTTNEPLRELTVLLQQHSSAHDLETQLEIVYLVSSASWNPSYDVRVQSDQDAVQVTYYGIIEQRTGEAWKNAKILLSTSDPSTSCEPPTMSGMTLGYKVERNMRQKKKAMPMMSMLPQMKNLSFGAAPPSITQDVASAEQGALSATFAVPRTATINSGDQQKKVTIGVIDINDCTFQYRSVPKLEQSAFLKAKCINNSPYTLLKGPTSVFFDGDFVSTSELDDPVAPGQEFETYLGVDPSVKISYRHPNKFAQSRGLLKSTTLNQVNRSITVHNKKKTPISILIVDQVPISTNEVNKVVILEPDFKAAKEINSKVEADGGGAVDVNIKLTELIEWDVSHVAASQKITLPLQYTIEVPSDVVIMNDY
ncbi:hypothetical protein AKO1_007418 [Acrasis kona]|uniref:Mucoidy inhibitor MuiA family protein n=1 Tax=Acrasis kona TaxID=1008807 RepID=A0AAW2YRL7_9EUKA